MKDQQYYQVMGTLGTEDGPYYWRVYYFSDVGRITYTAFSPLSYNTEYEALEACRAYMEEHDIEATLEDN